MIAITNLTGYFNKNLNKEQFINERVVKKKTTNNIKKDVESS